MFSMFLLKGTSLGSSDYAIVPTSNASSVGEGAVFTLCLSTLQKVLFQSSVT